MRSSRLGLSLLFSVAILVAACDSRGTTAMMPTAPTPVPAAAPTPVGVLPSTAVAVSGRVYDTANRPIAGARVQVVNGPQAGLATTAGVDGQFWLAGTFDDTTQFRATKEGYADGVSLLRPRCATCNPQHWVYFYLALPVAPADIAGDYTLTVVAAGSCSSLPAEFRTRTYTAKVVARPDQPTPASTSFQATFGGAALVSGLSWADLWIAVAGNYMELSMGDFHGQPGLVEQVGADAYVSIDGWGQTTVEATAVSTITTAFDGVIGYCELKPGVSPLSGAGRYGCAADQSVTRSVCQSKNHQLILTRR